MIHQFLMWSLCGAFTRANSDQRERERSPERNCIFWNLGSDGPSFLPYAIGLREQPRYNAEETTRGYEYQAEINERSS